MAFLLNVVTALGTVFAAGALIFTYFQIQQAKQALTAQTEYQISKDSAELWDTIPDNIWQELRTSVPISQKAERQIIRVFSFVAAVQDQRQLLDPEFWKEFTGGFCGFLQIPTVSDLWQVQIVSRKLLFSEKFIALGEGCRKLKP
jgi:hypothetical protein